MDVSYLLDSLNPAQREAVSAPPGHYLVLAGAGSGKTRTLTYRVAYLLENGVDPRNILLLTFTNKAARQMLDRVANLLPVDASGRTTSLPNVELLFALPHRDDAVGRPHHRRDVGHFSIGMRTEFPHSVQLPS